MESKMTVREWVSKYVISEMNCGETCLLIKADTAEIDDLKQILKYDQVKLGKAFLVALKELGCSVCFECRTIVDGEHPHTISV